MQTTVQVNLRLPPLIAQRVADLSQEQGIPRNLAYIRLLADALELEPAERLAVVAPEIASRRRTRAIVQNW